MKILLLAYPNSIHTIRWSGALKERGVIIKTFGIDKKISTAKEGAFSKLRALKLLPQLKKTIHDFQPDILHAHYASSYGLLVALCGFHPFVLSVWGSDVFTFPKKSFLHRWVLKYNLLKADKILSTSHVMAKETALYTNKKIEVTPFGIDLEKFKPMPVKRPFKKQDIVIGTVKTLRPKYGIDVLMRAFEIVKKKHAALPLKLLIVGKGYQEKELKTLNKTLGLANDTIFMGQVAYEKIPMCHNMLDISVSVSDSESFGVAIIEASACEKPVVVSNVGGLPEVVDNGKTGIVVPVRNPKATAEAIEKLLFDPALRKKMGQAGRARVKKLYDWDKNVYQMMEIYKKILKSSV